MATQKHTEYKQKSSVCKNTNIQFHVASNQYILRSCYVTEYLYLIKVIFYMKMCLSLITVMAIQLSIVSNANIKPKAFRQFIVLLKQNIFEYICQGSILNFLSSQTFCSNGLRITRSVNLHALHHGLLFSQEQRYARKYFVTETERLKYFRLKLIKFNLEQVFFSCHNFTLLQLYPL